MLFLSEKLLFKMEEGEYAMQQIHSIKALQSNAIRNHSLFTIHHSPKTPKEFF